MLNPDVECQLKYRNICEEERHQELYEEEPEYEEEPCPEEFCPEEQGS